MLFVTLEGTTSVRKIAELTTHGEFLERVLTDSIAVLLHNDLITLDTIAQDGMRVKASAASESFRTEKGLEKARHQAEQYLDQLQEKDGITYVDGTRPKG